MRGIGLAIWLAKILPSRTRHRRKALADQTKGLEVSSVKTSKFDNLWVGY